MPRRQAGRDGIGAFELDAASLSLSAPLLLAILAEEDNSTSDVRIGPSTSLRGAIDFANSDGVNSPITFAAPGAIRLASALPVLAHNRALSIRNTQSVGVTIWGEANTDGAVSGVMCGYFTQDNDGPAVALSLPRILQRGAWMPDRPAGCAR